MPVKFKINQLGPIRNSEVTLKPLMVFSGDSSTGKSYMAFLTYYFLNTIISKDKITTHINQKYKDDITIIKENKNHHFTFKIIDFKRWINYEAKTFISYLTDNSELNCIIDIEFEVNDFEITVTNNSLNTEQISTDGNIQIPNFELNINETKYNLSLKSLSNIDFFISYFISSQLNRILVNKNNFDKAVFLPPARAALVGFNFSEKVAVSSAGMYKEFLNDMDDFLSPIFREKYQPNKYINERLNEIISGTIAHKEGRLFYENNKFTIPITAAASSVKELAPIFVMLQKYAPNKLSVLLEEPEAHLHPSLQQKMADLISYLVGQGAYMQITTHSDYLLNRLNTLIKVHSLKKHSNFKSLLDEVNINEDIVLNPENIGAYYFKKNEDGTVTIVDQSTTEGVPFTSFDEAVNKMLTDRDIIEDYIENNGITELR